MLVWWMNTNLEVRAYYSILFLLHFSYSIGFNSLDPTRLELPRLSISCPFSHRVISLGACIVCVCVCSVTRQIQVQVAAIVRVGIKPSMQVRGTFTFWTS